MGTLTEVDDRATLEQERERSEPRFLSVEEAAGILGVDRVVILTGARKGQFVIVRIGNRPFVHREAFMRWLDAVERHSLSQVSAYLDFLEQQEG